ncbi:MAG: 3-phosphoshikimate 1-carboxyvinyltransferase [Gammaproteobacteria bacterium]|nr:3-phosphoshikimate 1-carboxyvinyltransferase [Gammaproteobacteria bacterium]
MALPDRIEVVPLNKAPQVAVSVPGSKSITNRVLLLAALAGRTTRITGALWSEDTQVMVAALRTLGIRIVVDPDPADACNRTLVVTGVGGVPDAGGPNPIDIFVGNAGTAARFLAAYVCLGTGVYRLHGVDRMHERPQAALFDALRQLGYRIDSPNDRLPATIHGGGRRPGRCRVSIAHSSQFASALLLCADHGGWEVDIVDEPGGDGDESPYVAMTSALVENFANGNGEFVVEPDASSGSYFWGAGWLLKQRFGLAELPVTVRDWPTTPWQIDARFPQFLPPPGQVSRASDLGDSIMTAIMLASFTDHAVDFNDLGRLRVQECERVKALYTELTRCGARVIERGDTLAFIPNALHAATVETYHDHRMAMCFGMLGLVVPGIRIINPACVGKTFPNFFFKLAAPPPYGLGVTLIDVATDRVLPLDDGLIA